MLLSCNNSHFVSNLTGSDARLRGTNQVFAGDIDESMVCVRLALVARVS